MDVHKWKVETAINSFWSKPEETIKNRMEDILASVDQWTQGLCEEVADTKKELHEEF
jgi:hypothetical protein